MDIPWSPFGIDGRWYDWEGLASAADLLFVMAYDMQSQVRAGAEGLSGSSWLQLVQRTAGPFNPLWQQQRAPLNGLPSPSTLPPPFPPPAYPTQIWGTCVASANSPAALVQLSIQQWLDLGVPASKLVLGLPW